jgi:hypothetical protein
MRYFPKRRSPADPRNRVNWIGDSLNRITKYELVGTVDEIDIWRSAAVMIRRYGDQADLECAMRADQAVSQDDSARESVWERIMRTVQDLQRQKPSASDQFN